MKQIFVLSKENLELSKQEVLRLCDTDDFKLVDNLLIIDTDKDYSNRLAYTNEIYEFLFEKTKDLEESMNEFDWKSVYKNSFSLKADNFDVKKLSSIIWNNLKNPKVDLKNAKTKIKIFKTKDKIICGRLIFENKKDFLNRKAHLRPELHPTSLDPRLARACINLTGKIKGKLLDPFCGSGGILIEAGVMGFDIVGYDIEAANLRRCQINLEHYKIKRYDLNFEDAINIKGEFDCIVTDLPYGKSSKADKNLETLYKEFLEKAYIVTNTSVVIFPDFINYKKLLGKWKTKLEFTHYIHKSLTKKIVLLEK
ncbi:methyltransferase domain-containing protein [Candidatus Woesearchaeota archaeon]|nr:methyltransferase domain-containing protein [Candidatus Woesearchaeota archaeon]